jgi:hypothetical protein
MKIGDLVQKKNGSLKAGIITGLGDRGHWGQMVEVVWPGCKPFWTNCITLEAMHEGR